MKFSSGGKETPCGRGSTMAHTVDIRDALPKLIERLGVKTMLDAGCGDANWIGNLQCHYHGIDNDIDNIALAKSKMPGGTFSVSEILDHPIDYDLVLLRHVIQHLTLDHAKKIIEHCLKGCKWLLVTNHPTAGHNVELPKSMFRPISLRARPFFLRPVEILQDDILELWLIEGQASWR